MDDAIKGLCYTLQEEANTIIRCTSEIKKKDIYDIKSRAVFETMRMDSVAHIQDLCLLITNLVSEDYSRGKSDE